MPRLRIANAEGLGRSALGDRLFIVGVGASAAVFVAIVLALIAELIQGSLPSIQIFGLRFLVSSEWNPVTQKFGALPLIFGTVVSSIIALLLAGVVGVLAAAYLADFAPRQLARPLAFVIELLAAVPSVVFGLWGLFVLAPAMRDVIDPLLRGVLGFVPLFQGPSYGIGLLTAGVLLALMIIPTVTAISRDVIASIPVDQREASFAVGATHWETMVHVVLTAARPGIFGALILALGRAIGETIAVTMVIGNRPQIVASLFAPSYTLASVIANEFIEATGKLYPSALLELGLLLLVISLIVNAIARLLVWTVFRKVKRAA